VAAGISGSYFHSFFQRGRTDLLKQVIRLNAGPASGIFIATSMKSSSLPSEEGAGFVSQDYQPVQEIQVYAIKKVSEEDDEEGEFPSATMEDYWSVMDERVMTFFNQQQSDINHVDLHHPSTPLHPHSSSVYLLNPLSLSIPKHKSEESSVVKVSTDGFSFLNKETMKMEMHLSESISKSIDLSQCSQMTVHLRSKQEVPLLPTRAFATSSIVNATNAPPKKRVRFDKTRPTAGSASQVESNIQYLHPTSSLYHEQQHQHQHQQQQQQPWAAHNKYSESNVSRSPRHFALQLPHSESVSVGYSHCVASTLSSDKQNCDNSGTGTGTGVDESPVTYSTYATVSTDSESSSSLSNSFESFDHVTDTTDRTSALRHTFIFDPSMVDQRSAGMLIGDRVDDNGPGDDNCCNAVDDTNTAFSLAHYFTSY